MTYGMVSADDSNGSNDISSNGIANFTVHVNNQNVLVFRYFNVSGSSLSLNLPDLNENKLVPLFWRGSGNVTILPAMSFSQVGNFSNPSYDFQYLFLYQSSYLGILLTTGSISESGGEIFVNNLVGAAYFTIYFINSPLSQFNFTSNSFQSNGNSYYGTYSSFTSSPGLIKDYSLINNQSSVSVISSIALGGDSLLSFNTSGLAVPNKSGAFASDGLFPLLYLDSFNSSVTIRLSDGFHFGTPEAEQGNGGGGEQDPFNSAGLPYVNERVFKIMSGSRTLGSVDVYGQMSINNTTLIVNSPVSFVVIRFLPAFQSSTGINHSNDELGNATTEIYLDNQAYFVPFSPNVTAQNLSFKQGTLIFQFVQNGTQQFVIVIQGNFSVSNFVITGNGSSYPHYSILRSGNETIVTFTTNGTGQRNLSLSVTPFLSTNGGGKQLPLMALIISVTALVTVAGSLIAYSRKRWERNLEKE
jgi:hypothetical protein